jgi:4-hydroxy-tetrahydrodipicolinate reductase
MGVARVCLVGATGRMGLALTRALEQFEGLELAAAVGSPGHAALGQDVGVLAGRAARGVPLSGQLAAAMASADVVIDFSTAAAIPATVAACEAAGCALLLGTTGYEAVTNELFARASRRIPLLVAANTSLALNVLLALVRQASAALPPSYDIEIIETHHRNKLDAPSGTALALGRAAGEGRGLSTSGRVELTGSRPGPRSPGSIGYAVARGGDVVGEHEVRLLGQGEQLRLSHIATDRGIFAQGALTAARWLVGKPAGRYSMDDVISMKSGV